MRCSKKRLALIELNEINFDIVREYVALDANRFPALASLLNGPQVQTTSEVSYEQLEPWIQWPSVHTGRTFKEHQIFRLGDIVDSNVPQIFEQLEQAGYKIGAISAMNAENRLKSPSYFVPDPWTQTPSDGSWWSRTLKEAISQAVNDNAKSKITIKTALQVALALLRFAPIRHYSRYFQLVLASRKKSWFKPLILDLLLHDVHWNRFNAKRPNFSALFLNAGAHIQHHYFFNAEPLRGQIKNKNPEWYVRSINDPLADALSLYDLIVGEYLSCTNTEVILATGLSQLPYDQLKFYYRLNSHAHFLKKLGIEFLAVYPRMTRDFLIEFNSEAQAIEAQTVLNNIKVIPQGCALFGEIDNRGKSLFVTLTFPKEITDSTEYVVEGKAKRLKPEVSFVAIKNGMHQTKGFAFFTAGIKRYAPVDRSHVSNLGKTILSYFGVGTKPLN